MSLKLITAATTPPVTLAEVKLAHRFDAADLDADIVAMVDDATRLVEHEVGQCLMPQTWQLTLNAFPQSISLTRPPVTSITSVQYVDPTGQLQTLDSAAYTLDATDSYTHALLHPAYGTSWPATRDQHNAVTVRFVSGYADADSVPGYLKRQVKISVAMLLDDPVQMADRLSAIDKVWSA